ncbi:binder of sperm protein homolog 2-like isoform X4 [Vombatus ursinus]|nr:binder of sperm protein homolog 2-like isoform X4 [Vombatus ursinus]
MLLERGLLVGWVCLHFCLHGANADLTRYRNIRPKPEKILKPCAFPFIYENVRYEHCTTVNSDFAWCSVDSIFNGKWRYCVSTEAVPCLHDGWVCAGQDLVCPDPQLQHERVVETMFTQ